MTATVPFHLGDILTVTTGLLVAPGGWASVHVLLEYMTDDHLMTHQLPRVMDECKPDLLRQHPLLRHVQPPDDFGPQPDLAVPAWLATQAYRYGEYLPVARLDPADHTRIEPLVELVTRRRQLRLEQGGADQ